MCTLTSTLSGSIQQVVKDFITSGRTFTAYNVTKEVRNRGCSETFTHKDVRVYIHELLDEYIDDNEVVREDSPTHPAFQYVPVLKVNVTAPRKSAQFNPVSTAVVAMKQTQTKPVVSGITSDLVARDKRNRVCLTKAAVASIGAKPGDTLAVGKLFAKIVVGFPSNLHKVEGAYMVDKDGNVRVCQNALTRLGISPSQRNILCLHSSSFIELT